MNREIKFRAWSVYDQKMFYDVQETYDSYWEQSFGSLLDNEDWFVMQYTGLKDKNGKEIYEGDILKGDEPGFNDVVVYKENKFILEPLGDDCIYWELTEVIGNIYENPELLEDNQ